MFVYPYDGCSCDAVTSSIGVIPSIGTILMISLGAISYVWLVPIATMTLVIELGVWLMMIMVLLGYWCGLQLACVFGQLAL